MFDKHLLPFLRCMKGGIVMCNENNITTDIGYKYTPHQPYLELNTSYYSYSPSVKSPLYGIVWKVYQVNGFDYHKTIAFPDACVDLMLFYTDEKCYCYLLSSTEEMRMMSDFSFIKDVKTIFGIRFYTGCVGNLFNGEIRDVGSNIIDGGAAFLDGQKSVEKLLAADNFELRWKIAEEYLLKRLSIYKSNNIVNYITKNVIENKGMIVVKDLQESTGYSERYLRRVVNENLGISIKQLCEITRFQWAYHLYKYSKGEIKLIDLAIRSGYYDQSHMNFCFKKLTGQLPRNVMSIYMEDIITVR